VSAASGSKERAERINRNKRLEAAPTEVAEVFAEISKKFLPFQSKRPHKGAAAVQYREGKTQKSGLATLLTRWTFHSHPNESGGLLMHFVG